MADYNTIKAAKADGFEEVKKQHYDGERLEIKGHSLVRNPKSALSRTAWLREGRKVKAGAIPHATLYQPVGNGAKMVYYAVYREDQVEEYGSLIRTTNSWQSSFSLLLFGERDE